MKLNSDCHDIFAPIDLMQGKYRDAEKSLARPWKETSYSNQDLQYYTKT